MSSRRKSDAPRQLIQTVSPTPANITVKCESTDEKEQMEEKREKVVEVVDLKPTIEKPNTPEKQNENLSQFTGSSEESVPTTDSQHKTPIVLSGKLTHPQWTAPLKGILIALVRDRRALHETADCLGPVQMQHFEEIAGVLAFQGPLFNKMTVLEKWCWLVEMLVRSRTLPGAAPRWAFAGALDFVQDKHTNIYRGILTVERFARLCNEFCDELEWEILRTPMLRPLGVPSAEPAAVPAVSVSPHSVLTSGTDVPPAKRRRGRPTLAERAERDRLEMERQHALLHNCVTVPIPVEHPSPAPKEWTEEMLHVLANALMMGEKGVDRISEVVSVVAKREVGATEIASCIDQMKEMIPRLRESGRSESGRGLADIVSLMHGVGSPPRPSTTCPAPSGSSPSAGSPACNGKAFQSAVVVPPLMAANAPTLDQLFNAGRTEAVEIRVDPGVGREKDREREKGEMKRVFVPSAPTPATQKNHDDKWTSLGQLVERQCRDMEEKSPAEAIRLQKAIQNLLCQHALAAIDQ